MIPRLYNIPEFRYFTGPLLTGVAIPLLSPGDNHNGKFLRRVIGWERAGDAAFIPLTNLVRARSAPLTLAEALAGSIALSRNGFAVSYAAGAVSDLGATLVFDSAEMEFLPPNEGLFLYPSVDVSTCIYTAQFYPDIKQAGR